MCNFDLKAQMKDKKKQVYSEIQKIHQRLKSDINMFVCNKFNQQSPNKQVYIQI